MPPLETLDLYQDAVLWPLTGVDQYNEPLASDPVQLKVRWEYRRGQMIDPKGTLVSVDATVAVNIDVAIDSLIALGTLDQWPGTAPASLPASPLMQVIVIESALDLKGRELNRRRELGLKYFRDTK